MVYSSSKRNGVSLLGDNNDGLAVTHGDTSALLIWSSLGDECPPLSAWLSMYTGFCWGRGIPQWMLFVCCCICECLVCACPSPPWSTCGPYLWGTLPSLAVTAATVTHVTCWVTFLLESGWVSAWHRHHEALHTFSCASKCWRTVCKSYCERAPWCAAGVSDCTGKLATARLWSTANQYCRLQSRLA